MSDSHQKTLKIVTNLDRSGIESRIAEVRNAARSRSLGDVAAALTDIEGMARAQMEARVRSALKLLDAKAGHKDLTAQLELVELNLPNLK